MRRDKILIWLTGIAACFMMLGVFVFLWSCSSDASDALGGGEEHRKNILVMGVDEAGDNTDMLMLCSMNLESGKTEILQIPRDTLYRTDFGCGKINRIYRTYSSKYDKNRAAEKVSRDISTALGVRVDAYLVFGGETVKSFVDLIGGVAVDVPATIKYTDSETGESRIIPKGERTLTGEEALAFVRHRESYAEGDLGRLDAQMSFLCGVYESIPKLKKWDRLMGVCQKILPNLLTNLREKDIIEIMMAYVRSRDSVSVSFARLPGEASYTNGVWYYVLHRSATEKLLADLFGVQTVFDADARFTDPTKEAVRNIYSYPVLDYRHLTVEDVKRGRASPKK